MKLIAFVLRRSLLMNLLTVLVVTIGIVKAMSMRREAFPAVDFDMVSIATVYPGASPKEVERYIADPIEREIKGITGIDEFNSSNIEGLSIVLVKLDPDQSEGDKNSTIDEIQRAVQRIKEFPDDLPDPPEVMEQSSERMPVLEATISGDVPYPRLRKIADQLADKIENISDVSAVERYGYRDREFWVEIEPKMLNRYNLSFKDVMNSIAAQNINLPGGTVTSDSGDLLVRTIGEVDSADAIGRIVLRSNDAGVTIRIKDIARVSATFKEEKRIYRTNGKPSVNLLIQKSKAGDIITLVDQVKDKAAEFKLSLGDEPIAISYVNDVSFFVRNRLSVLFNNGTFGIFLVLISLLLFLSPGIALVAAAGMPVAFAGAIAMMGYGGMTINLISMFALVIVLGMLVDDAIIVAENIWHHYEEGESPWDACVKGASEVLLPVTATILTTMAAFSPLLMISGIFGKFISQMPKVVMIALSVSLVEALLVLPAHAYDVLKLGEKRRSKKNPGSNEARVKKGRRSGPLSKVVTHYGTGLALVLRFRWAFALSIVGLLGFTLWFARTNIPLVIFPNDGVEAFFIRADLKVGMGIHQSAERFAQLEDLVARLPKEDLRDYVTQVGVQRDDGSDPFTQRGTHLGQVAVYLQPIKDRKRTADEIINELRPITDKLVESGQFERVFYTRKRTGPPVGKPVALRVRGDDLDEIADIADQLKEILKTKEGVSDVSENFRPGKNELQVIIDEKKAALSLLTVSNIAAHIRAAFEGQIASYVSGGDERIGIRVRFPESVRKELADLNNIDIPNATGNMIALTSVAHIEKTSGINAVFHRDGKRTITVTADIDELLTTSEKVNKSLSEEISAIKKKHPNVFIATGGEWEDTEKSMESLKEAFLIAMGLIFLILATQFSSLTQPFVVMAAIPFGIVGVIWAFFVHGIPLSFLGMIGTIGLSGVVVNDSIVLVDFVNNFIKQGMTPFEATFEAGKRRFRAVWLTTLTTVLGLLPLVYGFGGMDNFLRPAAVALGYGLIFGTVLVLFFVPALYLIRVDIINLINPKRIEPNKGVSNYV